jgi:hypothetical protein
VRGSVHCVSPSFVVLDCLPLRDMPVFLICSIDQRANRIYAENTMLRARAVDCIKAVDDEYRGTGSPMPSDV